jgi:tRNA (adenine-N(1)-)-methyltransferase non-catalytic subunit
MITFQEGDWVILLLPNDSERLVQLKSTENIDLGRFGNFAGKALLDTSPGCYYSVESDGNLVKMSPDELFCSLPEPPEISEITATNQTLIDTNTSQRLTTDDIEALKRQVIEGSIDAQSIVKTVIKNSETFTAKNAFSQIKYVQRKQRKFLKWFGVRETTIRTLSNYYMKREPRKIMDLRLDALSQIICSSNVQVDNAKVLVWDETLGFLTGAILSKVSPTAQVVNVHPDRQMQVPMIIHYNFGESTRLRLHSVKFGSIIDGTISNDVPFVESSNVDEKRLAIQRQRYEQRRIRRQGIGKWFTDAVFDTLIIATSKTDPLSIIKSLSHGLRPSSRVIVYSTWREILLPSYLELRHSHEWVDVALTETWLRPYQAAPGRIHPHMNCNGHSGTILSATKVITTLK